jgi:hypothetical protein
MTAYVTCTIVGLKINKKLDNNARKKLFKKLDLLGNDKNSTKTRRITFKWVC